MSVMHGFVSCNLCGATFAGCVVPPHACLHSLPQPPVDTASQPDRYESRIAALERELAEARKAALSEGIGGGEAEADLTALRQRHSEAVRKDFEEGFGKGWDAEGTPKTFTQELDAAWLASDAKARLI